MNGLFNRAFRAALFDRKPYTDWLFESAATADAAMLVIAVIAAVVVISGLIGGSALGLLAGLLPTVILGLASWILLGAASWFAGTRLFEGSGDWQTVIRLQGLAYLPNLLAAAGPLPQFIGYLWYLAAAVVGTEIALSQSRRNAGLSVLTGAALLLVLELLLGATFTGISGGFEAIGNLFS